MLLAVAGLAVGAALGGLFKATETENQLFGEASDGLKARVREAAGEQAEQLADAARQVSENILRSFDSPNTSVPEGHEP